MSAGNSRPPAPLEPTAAFAEPPALLRCRLTMRLLEETRLPEHLGPLLRGGFGYAFQRSSCPQPCWRRSESCTLEPPCPYRRVFEATHPPEVSHLHDLRDVPRPFVIEPPDDGRTSYPAGSVLEFGLVLIGRGIDDLPYFLFGFEQFCRAGLGRQRALARLERVEALRPWAPVGPVIYQDGRVLADALALPVLTPADIAARAAALPPDLLLTLRSPLRLKARGGILRVVEPTTLFQAICWRLHTLSVFYGDGPWTADHRALLTQAGGITVKSSRVHWVERLRTSARSSGRQTMPMGGLLGSAVLREVPPDLRALLLAGGLLHVGKVCVFGHGKLEVQPLASRAEG